MKKKIFTLLAILMMAVLSAQAADSNMLPGKFSVSATKQVQFAKSNLYWDGSAFQFEANQTDYPTEWNTSHVGHLAWTSLTDFQSGNASKMPYAQNYTTSNESTTDKFWCDEDNKLTVNGTSDLYVLSSAEWSYLISDRTNASNLYKFKVTVTNNGTSYSNCLVIAPDNYDFTTTPLASSYTLADLNAAGLVCLPAAGQRGGNSVILGKTPSKALGNYWTATPHSEYIAYAYFLRIATTTPVTNAFTMRNGALSIRLVKTVPPHVHSWATAWTSNDAGHWHACTAEDCPITDYATCGETAAAYGEHSYGSDKTQTSYYTCSTCGYVNETRKAEYHAHSWATTWSSDDAGHWHACTAEDCPITDYSTCGLAAAAYGAHSYGSDKTQTSYYTCSVCGHVNSSRKAEYDDATSIFDKDGKAVSNWDTYLAAHPNAIGYTENTSIQKNNVFVKQSDDSYKASKLVLTDGVDFVIPDALQSATLKADEAEYSRQLAAGQTMGTVVLPFAIKNNSSDYTLGHVSAASVYGITVSEYVADAEIAAGTPIFFVAETPGAELTFTASSTGLNITNDFNNSCTADGWTMNGTYEAISSGNASVNGGKQIYYIGTDDAFYYANQDFPCNAFRGWLETTEARPTSAPSRLAVSIIRSQPTGLDALENANENVKFLQNGKLYIRHNGQVFDANGKVIK